MPTISLSNAFVAQGLQCPPGKQRIEYCDADLPGLYVEVRATSPGQGTYYLRYKDASGKTCHQRIGRSTVTTLAEARSKVKALKAERTLGIGSGGAPAASAAGPTLDEFWTTAFLPHVKARLRSWRKYESLYRLHTKARFGHVPLAQLKKQDLQRWHGELAAGGLSPASSDHCLKMIRSVVNTAIDFGVLSVSPVGRLKLFNPDNRQIHDFMSPEEFNHFLATIRSYPNRPVGLLLEFLVASGCRLQEALGARWEHVDRAARVLFVPAERSKSGRIRMIPLSDAALQVLDRLGTEGRHERVFVSQKTGQPLRWVHKTFDRIRVLAGFPKLKMHSLRRQYALHALDAGVPLLTLSRALGHASVAVTESRYGSLSAKSLLLAANEASAVLLLPTTEPDTNQPPAGLREEAA